MTTMRDNAIRVKRFRELTATWRTNRERLLVGIDIAQAAHVAHLRQAHTRVVTPTLTIPNTTRGFTQLWIAIQRAQHTTGCREVVCRLEPTGTYHHAVAEFFEAHGADVLLLSSSVAYWNRRTQDGTWDKNDQKDAANCADLLEQGKVLFYSQPTGAARRSPPAGEGPPPGPGRTGELQGALADDAAPGAGPDGGTAPQPGTRRSPARPAGVGVGGPRPPGDRAGAAPARPGDRLRRSRGAGHGRAGADRGDRGGAHARGRAAAGVRAPADHSRHRPHGWRAPGRRDRRQRLGPRTSASSTSWPDSISCASSRASALGRSGSRSAAGASCAGRALRLPAASPAHCPGACGSPP